jgi:LuxR family transcriptional regulator, maltose regulon positive regulatory protein
MSALSVTAVDGPRIAALPDPPDNGATVVPLFERHAVPAGEPMVHRPALLERLSSAGRVTVVSAPGASGKTCLVRAWIVAEGLARHAGWVTVTPGERDDQRLWRSAIDALAGIAGGEKPADVGPALGGELIVERLLSGLRALRHPAVLVIDDLHELKSAEAQAQLERFLSRLPAQLRVVLLTRAAMGPGLHRLRLTGALTELGAADLRFSPQETRELLDATGVTLSDAGVAVLHERSEGWAGGLRLAAAQVATHPDPERFVREFSGSERTVAGYLRAEVLERMPPEVRDLLLRTSVLDRVSGPLADALAGASASLRVLQDLDDSGAFVTAVDVGRSWFRYHPMLADVLRLELRRMNPTLISTLHRVAGQWHEQHGDIVGAIQHAQAAGDSGHAAQLLADNQLTLMLDGKAAAARDRLGAFTADALTSDAELALASAMAHAFDGLYEETAVDIAVAEQLAPSLADCRRLRFALRLATARLWLARLRGDADAASEAFRLVESALSAQPPGKRAGSGLERAMALLNLGIAEVGALRLDEGRDHLEQALGLARRLGRPYLEMSCLAYLALAAAHSGRPVSEVRGPAEQAVSIAEAHGWERRHDAAAPLAVGGMALVWLGRFAEGAQWLDRAQHALTAGRAAAIEVLLHDARALLFLAQRRLDEAHACLREADGPQRALPGDHPLRLDLRARALRAALEAGDTAAVRAALADMPQEERSRPEMRLVAAALERSEGCPEHVLRELTAVVERSVPAVFPVPAAIEARLLDATAHDQLGGAAAAGASLGRALELAEPDGVVLPFALVGVRELLEGHRGRRTAHPALLANIVDMLAGGSVQPETGPLSEALSEAELRVIRYLPSNLKAPEIAAELCVSANTVRTHLRHIYSKLDAHTRTEAVTRARRLGLLAPSGLAR